ncbi:MAG: hypothetical protein Q8O56_11090 [Solirubrobacteraceae bacterium]|nr:hypothetical protein [Solirubrobacteraceae bacterium]
MFHHPTSPKKTHLRSALLATSAAAAAMLASTAVAQAQQQFPITLSVEQAPTRVAAWNGTAMWSSFDPATESYSLVQSVDGGPPLPVGVAPRRSGPFDVDLGTNRTGSTYAVYTRDDGDIYRLNVRTGGEAKITKLSSPTLVERDPTIQRGEIAFIRREHGQDQLRIGNTTSASKGSRLIVKKRAIASAELGSRHVAYVVVGSGPISSTGMLSVRVRNLSTGADREVYRATSGGANFANVTRPAFVAQPEGFVWARTNIGSGTGNRIVRYALRGSELTYAQGASSYSSTAWAGDTLGAATASSLSGQDTPGACTDAGVNHCVVQLTGPLSFDLRP